MNLRIEEQNLKFKISKKELEELLKGRCLNEKINFLSKVFIISINPQSLTQEMESKLILEGNEVYLTLLISEDKIKELSLKGRSREGVSVKSSGVMVSLQVDIRKDSRKAIRE